MNVQELIATLEDMNPEAEVKLAIQPTWAFQHQIGEVVEVPAEIDGLNWGVKVRYADGTNMDEEFEQVDPNTRAGAIEYHHNLTFDRSRMKDNGIQSAEIAAMLRGEIMTAAQAEELSLDKPPTIFIGEAGQDCYLPEAAAEKLGWSRS